MRRLWIGVAVAVLLAALVAPAASGHAGAPPHRGRWLTDEFGRVVIVHGVNMVNKIGPSYDPAAIGFSDDDAALLEQEGFNSVRLGIIYKALEPQRGNYNDAYLESIALTARMLGTHGIKVLVDFHQDLFNERFQGEGFPDWAVNDDGLPAQPTAGFPGNYFAMPALWRAYDHFFANDRAPDGTPLWTAYGDAWKHAAQRLSQETAVIGYDVFNEPWAGSTWPTCLNPDGCRLFDATLTEFFRAIFAKIREADPQRMVYYETHSIYAGGADVHIGDTGDANAGFSFHSYCLGALFGQASTFLGEANCPLGAGRPYDLADAQAARTGDALLMTEFGATDDIPTIARDLTAADAHMDSWEYWTYFGGDPSAPRPSEGIVNDPSGPVNEDPANTNVKWFKLDALGRPYPRAIAGTPRSYGFDPATKTFTLTYEADATISVPTEIFVPTRQYPGGHTVSVTGATATTSGQIVTLTGAAGTVTVTITP